MESGFGAEGTTPIQAETLITGLEVPWAIGFLPPAPGFTNLDYLLTERPGRVRVVLGGQLLAEPAVELNVGEAGEGGLLGLAVHPSFQANGYFYVYYTASDSGREVNRVERYRLSSDRRSASRDRVIIDEMPASTFHNGGRLRFGPDGMLYVGTGDARDPDSSQDLTSPNGKILRLTPDGDIPADNPFSGNGAYLLGIRNTQGFDWLPGGLLAVTDHGPSGELGRTGHDELNFARAGDNLGWPDTWRCDTGPGVLTPALVWRQALPPGGAIYYDGQGVPEWRGSILIATLGSRHLQRVVLDSGQPSILRSEVYLSGEQSRGRLREIVQAPDGSLYVTTSNCDSRGTCPAEKDVVLRLFSP